MGLEERFLKLRRWRSGLVGGLSGDILEIGVGTGLNLGYYGRSARVRAIEPDIVRSILAQRAGTEAGLHLAVQAAVAEHLPYAVASFDHVVSSLVFCSVADQRLVLDEIRRVLKPGGTLQMLEHVRPENRQLAAMASAVTPGWRRVAMNCHLDRQTVEQLQACGWTVQVHDRYGVFVRLSATWGDNPPG